VRPSPRANNQPTITEQTFKDQFDKFFAECEKRLKADVLDEWPRSWNDAPLGPPSDPDTYTGMQMKLLQAYDNGRPPSQKLWPVDKAQYDGLPGQPLAASGTPSAPDGRKARLCRATRHCWTRFPAPAGLPLECDTDGNQRFGPDGTTPLLVTTFRDAQGRIKRQAARFQVFVYDEQSPEGRPLKIGDRIEGGGNNGMLTEIHWQVYIANKKAC
jgi:hypothetical protein